MCSFVGYRVTYSTTPAPPPDLSDPNIRVLQLPPTLADLPSLPMTQTAPPVFEQSNSEAQAEIDRGMDNLLGENPDVERQAVLVQPDAANNVEANVTNELETATEANENVQEPESYVANNAAENGQENTAAIEGSSENNADGDITETVAQTDNLENNHESAPDESELQPDDQTDQQQQMGGENEPNTGTSEAC